MTVDMLEFSADELYFDQPMEEETQSCIDEAAQQYGSAEAERLLYRANFLEPEHPMVLVALYRYFYYQHCYKDALRVAERVLFIFSQRLGLPGRWQDIEEQHFQGDVLSSMTEVRFYLLALKGAGYIEMRLENYDSAIERLQKIVDVDEMDRLGAASLLQIAQDEVNRKAGIYRLNFNT
jgi:tetratricopeptide (TPR) repeat protein